MAKGNIVSLTHDKIPMVNAQELTETVVDNYNMLVNMTKKYETDDEYYKNTTERPSLFIWGAPGIGKTAIVRQAAKSLGVDLILWHLSLTEPSDMLGVPGVEIVDGKKRTVFYLPTIFPTSNGTSNKGAIIFFDEMNRAPEAVLAASLSLCLEGKVGSYTLPSKVLVIGAGNRPNDLGNGLISDIEPALMNRFEHVNLVLTPKDYEKWATRTAQGQEEVIPEIVSYIIGDHGQEFFHKLDLDNTQSPWPSPRSWTAASRKLIALGGIDRMTTKKIMVLTSRFVGNEAATKFGEFVELRKHFTEEDINMIFTNPEEAKPLPDRIDVAKAVAYAIAKYKKTDMTAIDKIPAELVITESEFKNLTRYTLKNDRDDIYVLVLQLFMKAHPYITYTQTSDPKYGYYKKILTAWKKEIDKVIKPEEFQEIMGSDSTKKK